MVARLPQVNEVVEETVLAEEVSTGYTVRVSGYLSAERTLLLHRVDKKVSFVTPESSPRVPSEDHNCVDVVATWSQVGSGII